MTLPLVHHINYCFINRKISKFDSVTLFSSKMHSNCSNLLLKMEKNFFFLPMQGTRVQPVVKELDPTCHKTRAGEEK